MLMLVGSIIVVLVAVRAVVASVRETLWLRSVRRTGRPVTGEVIDNEARNRPYYGGWLLYPVVRYQLDGKMHQGTIRNWVGKLELGSGVPLLVDPEDPYSPAAADRDTLVRGLMISLLMLAIGIALTLWAWHFRA
jgi:hypothetical protein